MKNSNHLLYWILMILFCWFVSVGCKTRSMQKESSHVVQSDSSHAKTAVRTIDTGKTIQRIAETKQSHTESRDTTKTVIAAVIDSAKRTEAKDGSSTTTFYFQKGSTTTITNQHAKNKVSDKSSAKNQNVTIQKGLIHDSVAIADRVMKKDSIGSKKSTQATGSGTVWAKWVPVAGSIVLVVALLFIFIYFKRK